MATPRQIYPRYCGDVISRKEHILQPWAPRVEARALFKAMLQTGENPDSIRELIAVPPEIAETLRAFARAHSEEAIRIELGLDFRRRVGEEFERLILGYGG
jgi:hypothetical protein